MPPQKRPPAHQTILRVAVVVTSAVVSLPFVCWPVQDQQRAIILDAGVDAVCAHNPCRDANERDYWRRCLDRDNPSITVDDIYIDGSPANSITLDCKEDTIGGYVCITQGSDGNWYTDNVDYPSQ